MNTTYSAETKLTRSQRYSVIGGVCSGIALNRGYSISVVRIVALLLLSISGVGLLAYLLGWVFIPKVQNGIEEITQHDPLIRDTDHKMLGGVCAGIAKLFSWDVSLVRVLVALLVVSGGIGVLPYFYAWIVVPRNQA
jgi:phage shock protein PspC (stress-responsive transcriptional regulator)